MMLDALLALALAGPPDAFMAGLIVPAGEPRVLVVHAEPGGPRSWSYDGALGALWLLSRDRPDEAGRVLAGLAAVQAPDGSLPFSFEAPRPPTGPPYVRSGAMAWVGYAAARYLDVAPRGAQRDAVLAMAHRLAGTMLLRRIGQAGDPRDGLITGGSGHYTYTDEPGTAAPLEVFVPGEVPWASCEHNIDAWFFLREFGRVTGNRTYAGAAEDLAHALVARLWDEPHGQFWRGASPEGPDTMAALDCASWGAIFLDAAGDTARAERALSAAERRYFDHDRATGVTGHRPYTATNVYESAVLQRRYAPGLAAPDWDHLSAVWPEGSAGVALACWRLGRQARAKTILGELDRLRGPGGGLPCLSTAVPMDFTAGPTLAGTAWVELVRAEMNGWRGVWAR